ncbi:MAG: nucleotidyltransferase family protein [Acidimicrobiales bacterium]|nr:nucleotidyltransferase family protein [Acidimicrobiales bacterium]
MTTAAIVLAAGGGTRFVADTHKLLAPLRGRAVVHWAVQHAVAAGLDQTFVVTGAADLTGVLPSGVTVVANPRWAEGQSTSLRAGVAAADLAGHDVVVVGLGDQPLVSADAWRVVADADGDLVVATYDGVRSPPVRIAAAVWPLLPASGDAGARELMRRRPDLVREIACEGNPADVDTLEDLHRWS